MYTLSIQPSFEEVIEDIIQDRVTTDQFWINFVDIENLEDGIAAEETVTVSKEGQNITYKNQNGLKFYKAKDHHYKIEHNGSEFEVVSPLKSYKSFVKNSTSFDISPNKDLYIVGNGSGDLSIGRTIDSGIERTVKGAHYAEITKSLFFPSGQVALTASLDLNIKIWDVASGANPRTFLSHKDRITDLVMIEKGRNFVSSSLDGYIKLWDCGSGINFKSFKRTDSFKDGVTSLYLSSLDTKGTTDTSSPDNTYEFGTSGKQLIAGHVSGVITVYDLGAKDEVLTLPSLDSEVVGLWSNFSENKVLSGYSNGWIAEWDVRAPSSPLAKVKLTSTLSRLSLDGERIILSHDYDSGVICLDAEHITSSRPKTILGGIDDTVIDVKSVANNCYIGSGEGEIYLYKV